MFHYSDSVLVLLQIAVTVRNIQAFAAITVT